MADKSYRVVRGVSTRASADPASPQYGEWVDFEPGDVIRRWPAHLPVDELVESGALEPVKPAKGAK